MDTIGWLTFPFQVISSHYLSTLEQMVRMVRLLLLIFMIPGRMPTDLLILLQTLRVVLWNEGAR